MSYQDYQLKEATRRFIAYQRFTEPTMIQQAVIPYACKGKDIIGVSATGSGKTHAFLIPIMEQIDPTKDFVQVVITAPTRELALQLYRNAQDMEACMEGLRVKLITGGVEKSRMMEQLKQQPHLVIGTPGRIKDLFVKEAVLRLEKTRILVVDEADMTLEFGFLEDVDAIAGKMGDHLQMMSFSATIPQELQFFLRKYMKDPRVIQIDHEKSLPAITHVLIPCKHKTYEEKLLELLPLFQPYVCLIFANTRKEAASAAQLLRDHGYGIVELHGDLTSRERVKAMKELREQKKSYVVATDLAARGIDIEGITHVVSLGFPKELNFYIHRSGRTARTGRDGICYALYQKQDQHTVELLTKKGVQFIQKGIKNNAWQEIRVNTKKPNEKEILIETQIKKVAGKKKKVKPGYKVKRRAELDQARRKAKRMLIQEDIKRQKKERAKAKQIEKRGM